MIKLNKGQDKASDVMMSDAEHILLYGGSRSGKTFLICLAIIIRALKEKNTRHIIFRSTFTACKASIGMETIPDVLRKCFPELPSYSSMLNKTDWVITLPNGSEIWLGGLESGERLDKVLGKEYATIYLNEVSQIPYGTVETVRSRLAQKSGLAQKMYYDMNPTTKHHWTYKQFVEKVDPIDKRPLRNPEKYAQYRINPSDNVDNLADGYIQTLENLSEKKRKRFLHGEFADDSEGALFTIETIAQNRVFGQIDKPLPDFVRLVVAVDPSGCDGKEESRSDEIGIIVVGLGTDGHAYVLEDLSGKYRPEMWASLACDAFDRNMADCIVGESNFGGDMVRACIQAQNPSIPFVPVTASRGKTVRAHPISELYDQKKVHHVGIFHDLEEQMCCMMVGGYIGLKSPDRADALVWAITALFPKMTKKVDNNHHKPNVIAPVRGSGKLMNRRW